MYILAKHIQTHTLKLHQTFGNEALGLNRPSIRQLLGAALICSANCPCMSTMTDTQQQRRLYVPAKTLNTEFPVSSYCRSTLISLLIVPQLIDSDPYGPSFTTFHFGSYLSIHQTH